MLKTFILILSLLLTSPAFATEIFLTNQSNEVMHVDSTMPPKTSPLVKGRSWQGGKVDIPPYATKRVLRFNRNENIAAGITYSFTVRISKSDDRDPLMLQFSETGKLMYGSNLSIQFKDLDARLNKSLNADKQLSRFETDWDGEQTTIYQYFWLPVGELFNSYHYVIEAPQVGPVDVSKQPGSLSVLSYNTQMMPFYAGIADDLNQPNLRVKKIPGKIKQYDVVIMQELFDHSLRNRMINAMKKIYPYHTRVVGMNSSRPLTGGVVIFSKWPIETEKQVVYQHSSGMDGQSAKGAGYAKINKLGTRYHVFGTHLQAYNSDDALTARANQLSTLAKFIDAQNIPTTEAVLIGGDFNIDENSDEFQVIQTQLNVANPINTGYRYSYDSKINTMTVDNERGRLDYIFYQRNHLNPSSYNNAVQVIREFDDSNLWQQFDLSDHFPISALFVH